jgi:hypothetical protein
MKSGRKGVVRYNQNIMYPTFSHSDATGAPLKFENEERMHLLVRGTRLFGPDDPYCSYSHNCCSELRTLCPNIVITAALKSELSSSDRFCSPQGTRYSCAPANSRQKGPNNRILASLKTMDSNANFI